MVIEMIHSMIACPPFVDFSIQLAQFDGYEFIYSVDTIIYSIVMTRIYLVFRLYEQYSYWTNIEAADIW